MLLKTCLVLFLFMLLLNLCAYAAEAIPRPEHPRPDRLRGEWLNLNGQWGFAFDDADRGLNEQWHLGGKDFDRQITVPFPFQAELSGIGTDALHHVLWYHRTFTVPESMQGQRILLHFGAVDYRAQVWLNGTELGMHEGGHVPFYFDATKALIAGANQLILRVVDTEDKTQPRGKQFWEEVAKDIWYTRTSGIWQTVWLEAVGETWLQDFKITPKIDASSIDVEVTVDGPAQDWKLHLKATDRRTKTVVEKTFPEGIDRCTLDLGNAISLWSPEEPNLYDITLTLVHGDTALDSVDSYFGMRKIEVAGNKILLNNKPYYQRLILDQGYWPDGILTAPSDDALRYDIEITKALGYNGSRKHQKVEDPRWLYWADTLGLLVWGEMAAQHGPFIAEMEPRFMSEWLAAVKRDYNHPCIITWVPFNETWGIEGAHVNPWVQRFVERAYHATKAIDPYRPVCDNSGWDHVLTDIADYHDYASTGDGLKKRFELTKEGHYTRLQEGRFMFFVEGRSYGGEPIILSEFGGIGLLVEEDTAIGTDARPWAYGESEKSLESFIERYRSQIEGVRQIDEIAGFCYTQLTDVGQEMNGLLTYDRKLKCDPAIIKEITEYEPEN